MMHKAWCSIEEVTYWFFEVIHQISQAEKLTIWIQFEITRPVAAIKSLRFALLFSRFVNRQNFVVQHHNKNEEMQSIQ